MLRWLSGAVALLLLVGVAWLLGGAGVVRSGAELLPVHLTLRAGERGEISLVSHEQSVVAVAFRLRFDEAIVSIDTAEPRYASILEGGPAVVVPIRRGPGVLEVPGMAVTGGRGFKPRIPLYRFTIRAVAPGETAVAVDAFTVVDGSSFQQRSAGVAPCRVTVRP